LPVALLLIFLPAIGRDGMGLSMGILLFCSREETG
jgi:hypothetical protein